MNKHLLKTMLLLCALVVGSTSVWAEEEDTYTRIAAVSELSDGDQVIFVSQDETHACGTTQNTNNRSVVEITTTNHSYTYAAKDNVQVFTVKKNASGKYGFHTGSGYIYSASTSKNNLKTNSNAATTVPSGTAAWTLSITKYVVSAQNVENTKYYLQFNIDKTGALFSQYQNTMSSPYIYKKYVHATGDATTTTIDASGITNVNKFLGTAAGTLTASVVKTDDSSAIASASVTWSSSDESIATVGETTGVVTLVAAGTTTITATYAGVADTYQPSWDNYELTVIDENPDAVTLWSEDFSGDFASGGTYSYSFSNSDTKTWKESNAGGTSPELLVKGNDTFQATIPLNNILGDLTLKFKTNAKSITIDTTTDGVSISGDAAFSTKGEHKVIFTGVTPAMTSIAILFKAGSDNVRLDDIVLKGSKVAPVTLGNNGYATFASSDKLDLSNLPEGLTAYKAAVDGTAVKFTTLSQKVPANTGVMLKGEADATYNIPVVAESTDVADNAFLVNADGNTFTPDDDYNYFGLKKNTLTFGLFDPATVVIPATKAYLKVSKSSPARELTCVFDDETTGVSAAIKDNGEWIKDNAVYNFNGQRVNANHKGIVIVNGHKVIIK